MDLIIGMLHKMARSKQYCNLQCLFTSWFLLRQESEMDSGMSEGATKEFCQLQGAKPSYYISEFGENPRCGSDEYERGLEEYLGTKGAPKSTKGALSADGLKVNTLHADIRIRLLLVCSDGLPNAPFVVYLFLYKPLHRSQMPRYRLSLTKKLSLKPNSLAA